MGSEMCIRDSSDTLFNVDLALARNTVSQFEINDSVLVKDRLVPALLASVELALEVAQNYQLANNCDEFSDSIRCFESRSVLDEARDLLAQAETAAIDNTDDAARFAEEAWNRSVEAINVLM